MRALGSLATPSDLGAMLKLVVESKSAEDRPVLVAAVAKLLPRCEDKDQSVALMSGRARPVRLPRHNRPCCRYWAKRVPSKRCPRCGRT